MDRGIGTQVALYIEVHRVISGGFGRDFKEVLPESLVSRPPKSQSVDAGFKGVTQN